MNLTQRLVKALEWIDSQCELALAGRSEFAFPPEQLGKTIEDIRAYAQDALLDARLESQPAVHGTWRLEEGRPA